jgi:hypothetical protein
VITRYLSEEEKDMIGLAIDLQIFHNGIPVQLLYCKSSRNGCQIWRVRPLFVEESDRDQKFYATDRITFLHTLRAHHAPAMAA